MAGSQLYRYDSVTGEHGILNEMKHHKRTGFNVREAAHIDASRTPLNYSLMNDDSPEAIAMHAKIQMLKAGVKPRKNCVMAVEIVFSLPVNRLHQDTRPFFIDCFNWVKNTYAGEMISFDVHLDESAPHAHTLILPLIDGQMQGDKLKGDRAMARLLQDKFHNEVAIHHGLTKSYRKKLTHADRKNLLIQVINKLKADPVMQSSVWACLRDAIAKDPIPFAQALSINPSTIRATNKSFVQIMTSKGKGKATEINPIGI